MGEQPHRRVGRTCNGRTRRNGRPHGPGHRPGAGGPGKERTAGQHADSLPLGQRVQQRAVPELLARRERPSRHDA